MSRGEAVVVGTATVDLLAVGAPALPRGGGDEFVDATLVMLPRPPQVTIGGNGGNCAYALGRLGIATRLLSPLGDDLFGQAVVGWLSAAGVVVERVGPDATSVNYIATTVEGDRASFFFPVQPDADGLVALAASTRLKAGDHLHLAGFPHPAVAAMSAWLDAADGRATCSLDVGPVLAGLRLGHLEELLPRLGWVMGNEAEIAGLTGDADHAVAVLRGRLRGGVVVKRGARGVAVFTSDDQFHLPARELDAPTTVGAGDAFDAGFVAALMRGRDPRDAAAFGQQVAAVVLQRGRGVLAAPTADEVDAGVGPQAETER